MLERDSSALIFRISAVPGMMAGLVAKLRAVALQGELDFVALARAAGILYAAFLAPNGKLGSARNSGPDRYGSVPCLRPA